VQHWSWLAALVLLTACRSPERALTRASASASPAQSVPSAPVQTSAPASRHRSWPGTLEVRESEKASLVRSITRFGVALYQKLAEHPGNVLFSPLGVSSAFALLDAGARGRTAKQIEDALGWGLPPERVRASYAALLAASERGGYVQACRLFGTSPFSDAFGRESEQRFGAELEITAGGTEPTRAAALGWLREHGAADSVVPKALRPGLVLVQTASLRGAWRWPFAPERTEPALGVMHQTMTVPTAQVGKVSVVELPYSEPGFALDLLVPETGEGLRALERALSVEYLEHLWAETRPETVELRLPKFSLASTPHRSRELGTLGLREPFTPTADWTGISTDQRTRPAFVLCHARLRVDERGSDATATARPRPSAGPALPRVLVVKRPFLVVLRDVLAGTILLMGRVAE
jgi:serpin B